jgi:hypothetical protein
MFPKFCLPIKASPEERQEHGICTHPIARQIRCAGGFSSLLTWMYVSSRKSIRFASPMPSIATPQRIPHANAGPFRLNFMACSSPRFYDPQSRQILLSAPCRSTVRNQTALKLHGGIVGPSAFNQRELMCWTGD